MRDLVEKAKDGDLEAFGTLIDHYRDMVYGASYAILGSFHDAQDASQDAFVQAWQKMGALKDCGSFPGWLYRITRNLSLDRARRSRAGRGSIDDVAEAVPDHGNRDPRQCAEQRELHEAVLEAIRSLSEPNRLATALFYINGYSVEEVADFLDVPAGTVKRRLHDSRTQLRERMVNMVEDTFKRNSLPRDFSREALQRIGDFACLDIIGAGGMGSVYLAEHPVLKHKVAIKIAADLRPELQELFRSPRAALERLNHPGFVKILSHGEHEGRPYVVMEYLQGSMQLQGWLSRGAPPALWDILQIMVQLMDAVVHAHDRGVVIGCMCITPVHIMMLPNDAPVFIDASIPQPSPREHVKGTGMSWIRYLAPECVKEEQPNKQTDIWNMGVLMYEVLVGKPLFDGASEDEILWAIESPEPVDMRALKDRAPDYVVRALETCLAKAPQNRFPSAAQLLDALEEAQFAALVRLGDYDIQRLLLDVETGRLAAALGGAAEEITAHIFRNVPHRVADQIRQEMAERPPTPDTAHAARLAIVATASRLLKEQRISF
jgi:RNA polymerase sigma factor (sigma-70 family)